MKAFQKHIMSIVFFFVASCFSYINCCSQLTPDPELSPPIIKGPIYGCSGIAAYSGVKADAKVQVLVNGLQVAEVNSWIGWGEVKLPNALKINDVVSAKQVVDGRISGETRDPESVVNIPPNLRSGYLLLKSTEIVPPLYECQQAMRVIKILEGATAITRNVEGNTYRRDTPYNNTAIRTPKLELNVGEPEGPNFFNTVENICIDKVFYSHWSRKEYVKPKPSSLPKPVFHTQLISGMDTIVLDNLTTGAEVYLYALNNQNQRTIVGHSIAPGSSVIMRIDPPIDISFKYDKQQVLCDVKSPLSPPNKWVTPVEDVPPPSIQPPVCAGKYYVKICDTIPRSSIVVYVNGQKVTEGSGSDECVTLALGNNKIFPQQGDVTAKQWIDGRPSPTSPVVPIQTCW